MRPHYAEYVKHAMRYYSKSIINASSGQPRFKTEADKKNWNSCHAVMKQFTPEEQDILLTIYSENDTLPDNIYELAKKMRINQDRIWSLVNDFEKKVAKRRGLT